MHSYLILLFVVGTSLTNCLVQVETSDGIPYFKIQEQNPEAIRKPLQEINSNGDRGMMGKVDVNSKDAFDEGQSGEFIKELENQFVAALIRLFEGGDELYKDARFNAIIEALKASFLTVTGDIDHEYIRDIIEKIRKWDAQKRQKFDEISLNRLGCVKIMQRRNNSTEKQKKNIKEAMGLKRRGKKVLRKMTLNVVWNLELFECHYFVNRDFALNFIEETNKKKNEIS
ncbi:uncharacterized protein CEXT_511271 [Caerostris extrusa]|uniref:Uncharacterized protein n=1 Tax=Caerostris extrusa TaxID=172846 RepID=A0AAV4WC85_CAEEX|nr:uncharacterized protein CEXT_511271 [Caerostris extrusa]